MVLGRRNYLYLSIIASLVAFALLYYLLVSSVADNDIWIAVMMSGAGFVTESIVTSLFIAVFFGIYLSLVVFKISMLRAVGGGGFFGLIGSGVGAFGVGCPTCGAFLFSLIGAPLALTFLPFRGAELRIASIGILALSIYFTSKSINASCKIKL